MAHHRKRSIPLVAGVALTLAFSACGVSTSNDHELGRKSAADKTGAGAPGELARTLGWSELGYEPARAESLAHGPNAVALTPSGAALILDWRNGRVVLVDRDLPARALSDVPVDAEDLIAGSDGAFVVTSPLRARAWFFESDGTPSAEMALPRSLRDLSGLSLGPSRRLIAHTSYQESLVLGSPSAPLPLPVTLASKREGAYQLPDGRGVAVKVDGDTASVVVLTQPSAEARTGVALAHTLPHSVTAARIVGAEGKIACLRLERVTSTPTLSVARRALCLDVESGQVSFDHALPAPGVYMPRTELAVGGGRLGFIHPTAAGLELASWAVPGMEAAK